VRDGDANIIIRRDGRSTPFPDQSRRRGAVVGVYILGLHNGEHDAGACLFRDYELISAISLERLTRKKKAGVSPESELPLAAIDDCLAVAGIGRRDIDVICVSRTHFELQSYILRGRWRIKQAYWRLRGSKKLMMLVDMGRRQRTRDSLSLLDQDSLRARYGFRKAKFRVYNHHAAHALPAYFYSEFDEALIYTADGIGDNISYSASVGRRGGIEVLSGGDDMLLERYKINSVGFLYSHFTEALGFISNRHEGKVTGLAGFGRPVAADEIAGHFTVDDDGEIRSEFSSYAAMHDYAEAVCARLSREDAAASVQEATERIVCKAVATYQARTGMRSLALGGGVFANVRLNRVLLEQTSAERIFVFPAMGDEGLPVGGCLLYLLERDGAATWQANRKPLSSLYLGRSHDARFAAVAAHLSSIAASDDRPVEQAIDALVAGRVVAIYTGRMEFGPRALGARSILAAPVKSEVNDTINKRLERSEFMPFAPVVLESHASRVFDINPGNAHAARFMTITCAVNSEWRERIPAVVHVDGSARPQIIGPQDNALYYRVLDLYYQRTGIPVLVNTSFNVHEEPIVDTPEQALKSLVDGRIDHILTGNAFFSVDHMGLTANGSAGEPAACQPISVA
jgi:carbamoyltransferase